MKNREILVTARKGNEVLMQQIMPEQSAFQLHRKILLKTQLMEETSADLHTMDAFNKLTPDNAVAVSQGNRRVTFQTYKGVLS